MKVSLKAMRTNAGITQTEAAKAVGVTKKTIHSWETSKTYPSIMQLLKLCKIYGCGVDDIFLPDKLAQSE